MALVLRRASMPASFALSPLPCCLQAGHWPRQRLLLILLTAKPAEESCVPDNHIQGEPEHGRPLLVREATVLADGTTRCTQAVSHPGPRMCAALWSAGVRSVACLATVPSEKWAHSRRHVHTFCYHFALQNVYTIRRQPISCHADEDDRGVCVIPIRDRRVRAFPGSPALFPVHRLDH